MLRSTLASMIVPVRPFAVLALSSFATHAVGAATTQGTDDPPTADVAPLETNAPAKPWYEAVQVNGYLSFYAETNFNSPKSRTSQFRIFDAPADSFELPVAGLVVQKPVALPSESGFRVDLVAGSTIPRATAARGLFRDPVTGEAEDFDVQQAFVSWIAPVGNGLRFDVGKYATHMGIELIDGYDGWNDNATRSFLFGFAIPSTHTGVRMTYPFSDQLSAHVQVINGWDDVRDNNSSKSVCSQIAYKPCSDLSLYLNGISGPEQQDDEGDSRDVFDFIAVWKTTEELTLGLNADYGTEENAAPSGGDAIWSGAAGYVRYGFTPRFSLALRAEQFDDRDGARTGVDQRLRELTLTPEFRIDDNVRLRFDLRHDWSDQSVFETDNGTSKGQTTALVSVIWSF